jgi:hypothetical protein
MSENKNKILKWCNSKINQHTKVKLKGTYLVTYMIYIMRIRTTSLAQAV